MSLLPPPTVEDFLAFFPEFSDTDVTDVQAVLNQANIWVDPLLWADRDYQAAVMYLAAHFLQLAEDAAAQSTGSGGGGSGTVQTYLSRVSVGDRSVMWRAPPSGGRGGGGAQSESDQYLDLSTYGQQFLLLRSRNIMPIFVLK